VPAAPALPDIEALRATGLDAGLDAVEVATAEPFVEVRTTLVERKAAGLHGGMSFTYRSPERSTDPGRALPDARALVVGARSYLTDEPPMTVDGPAGRVARYAWDDHYTALKEGLSAIGAVLKDAGWRARVVADDNALVDRAAAHRAGIGWWGKNANLLLPGLGSWYVLGSVITDAPLATTAEAVEDRCGTCTRCIVACPTGAITAPGVVDARRCLSWLLQAEGVFPVEHRAALGDRIYGCDECQDVCPPNRRAPIARPTGAERPWAPLLELLDDDDAIVLAWADRWYIPRREVRYVRRNALVVLGNVGDGTDPAVAAVLRRHLAHPDPLLRAHAVWAARRLGREDLVRPLQADSDPSVAAELAAVVPIR
jgi:epoxyqueuosine reductase